MVYIGIVVAPKFDFDSLYRSLEALETEVVDGKVVQVEAAEVVVRQVQEKKKSEVCVFCN